MRLEDGRTISRLCGHFKAVTSLAFSPANLELFSGSNDRAILIWDSIDNSAFQDFLDGKDGKVKSEENLGNQLTQDAWSSSEDES